MCTWTATTVIEHYNRNGRPVYACAMDLSKAFDLVEWPNLFKTLMDKCLSPIFLRILFFLYKNQLCNVKWNGFYSRKFQIANGVRQGAVSSPLLFSLYIDHLFILLRNSGLGCSIDKFYFGVLGYADDLLLLSASRSGLQAMVSICEQFAKLEKLKFSTNIDFQKSKTKCIIFTLDKKPRTNVAPIILNNDPLPWVDNLKHLGNILDTTNSMKKDCLNKRGKFIGQVNSLLQELHFAASSVKMKLLNIYTTSFYGSSLWDIYSQEVTKLYSSWNVTVRNVYSLPWKTHRYLIQDISECVHPKTMLSTRFVKFLESVSKCEKSCVRYLGRIVKSDKRTLVGRTLAKLALECGCDVEYLTSTSVRRLGFFSICEGEK